jgi:hypothetical protein
VVLHPGATDGGLVRAAVLAALVVAAVLVFARPGQAETAGVSTCHRLLLPAIWLPGPGRSEPPGTANSVGPCPASGDPSGTSSPLPTATATPTPTPSAPPGAAGGTPPPSATATASPPPAAPPTRTPRPDGSYACPCSVWDDSTLPSIPSQSDRLPVEVGVKFQADVPGYVAAVRFYRGPANAGRHVGKLWMSTGTLLASATFENETATGWQQASFPTPVPIAANTTYVISYFAPEGGYAASEYFFVAGARNPPLRLLRDGEDGGNGVFAYYTSQFPTESYHQNNYSIDLVFTTDATRPTSSR